MYVRKKMIIFLCVVTMLVTMLSVAAFPMVAADNFVQSFENGGDTTTFAWENSITEVSTDMAHTGDKSLKMVMYDDYGNQTANRVVYENATEQVKFAFGKKYVVSFWIYAPVSFQMKPRLIMDPDLSTMSNWVSGKGMDLDDFVIPAGEWVQIKKTITLNRPDAFSSYDSTYLSAGVVATNALPSGVSSYTVYMDDLSIEEYVEYVPVPGVQSFEDGGATTTYAHNNSSTAISTDVAFSGGHSLKMVMDDDYGNQTTNRVVYEQDGEQVKFAFGKKYVVSFWIYAPVSFQMKPRIILDPDLSNMNAWVSGKGIDLQDFVIPAGEWVQIRKMITLNRPDAFSSYDSTYLSAGVVATNALPSGVSSYTVYMDDLSIEEYKPEPGVQSFEDGGATTTVAQGSSITAVSTDRARSGMKSLKIVLDKDYGSANTNRVVYEQDGEQVPFALGKEYMISFWLYAEESFQMKPRLAFDPDLDSTMTDWVNGKAIDLDDFTIPAGQWVQVQKTLTVNAPAGYAPLATSYLSVGVAATNALPAGTTYTVYMDDVSIRSTEARDGIVDFENGVLGTHYGNVAISREQAHGGSYAAKMTIIDDRSNNNCERILYVGSKGPVRFAVNKRYSVSLWVYAPESFNAKVKLISDPDLSAMDTWLANKGQDMLVGHLPAGQWTQVKGSLTVPAIAGETETHLSVGVTATEAMEQGAATYIAYVDDIVIEECADLQLKDMTLRLSGTDTVSAALQVPFSIKKADDYYTDYVDGDYVVGSDLAFGLLCSTNADAIMQVGQDGVTALTADGFTQDAATLTFATTLPLTSDLLDKTLTLRPYLCVEERIVYGDSLRLSPSALATLCYRREKNEDIKVRLASVFDGVDGFDTAETDSLSFVTFGDFHYNPERTATSLRDLDVVIKRANDEGADFVFSLGDFFQRKGGWAQQYEAFHNNEYDIPTYNIYGNHELEDGGTMAKVTPNLVYDNDAVVWGTADGKMDIGTGYYYFDQGNYRVIALDNNYYTDAAGVWHHNPESYWGSPENAVMNSSFGPTQLAWLENVLEDAVNRDKTCLVMTHIPIDKGNSTNDYVQARTLLENANAAKSGTVLAVFCGHEHSDRQYMVNGILYKYVNVVRGCVSDNPRKETEDKPYVGLTYEYDQYDEDGNYVTTYDRLYTDDLFWQSLYSADPMSSLVTVYADGALVIDGYESSWLNGELPQRDLAEGEGPRHSSLIVVDGVMTVAVVTLVDEEAPEAPELKMNPITSVFQYVGGAGDNSSLQAEAGSAVYTHADGSLRTAFRVGATYKTDKKDFSTIVLDDVSYPIEERGIILGKAGQSLTVD
ncbi:MAG: hypothetical protein E7541_07805, partial [Ruminococcaceae bacterium]|nr:hypothetical protein [Oscillospiraceae bacterium]